MRLAAAIEYIPEATGPPPPRSMVSRRCSTFPRTSLRPLLGARRSSRPGERIAVAAAWDARRGEVKTGLPDGRPQAEIQLTTGEKTACRAFSRSGRPIPLAAAPVGPYRQDGDGNYVATFAGASPESRALGRHFRRAQPLFRCSVRPAHDKVISVSILEYGPIRAVSAPRPATSGAAWSFATGC